MNYYQNYISYQNYPHVLPLQIPTGGGYLVENPIYQTPTDVPQPSYSVESQQAYNAPHLYAPLHNAHPNQEIRVQHPCVETPVIQKPSKPNCHAKSVCAVCKTTETPLWRRGVTGETECNACNLYFRKNKRRRPCELLHKPVGKRNRRKITDDCIRYQQHKYPNTSRHVSASTL